MVENFTRYSTADYVQDSKEMASYLDACMEEDPGDGSLIRIALNEISRAHGMSQLARETGISREGLYKAFSTTGNPEFSTVVKVIKSLGLRLHVEAAH